MDKNKVTLDLRYVSAVLAVVIVAMFIMWQPWNSKSAQRTIKITGEATINAEPDQYEFYPEYQKSGSDRAAMQKALIAQVNEVVAKLKELGVAEKDITLDSSSYEDYWTESGKQHVSNTITITVDNKELAQKVQDYLITTTPNGQLSPYPTFSTAKRKELEDTARSKAIDDAKDKAQTTADQLELSVGKVIAISDENDFGSAYPLGGISADSAESSGKSLPVLPGEQEISYVVYVTYQLR